MKTQQSNFRLSQQAQSNLKIICDMSGVNQTAAVEMALAALVNGLTNRRNLMNKIYETPENWGEVVYADEPTMREMIDRLNSDKNRDGYGEWNYDFGDCVELEQIVKRGKYTVFSKNGDVRGAAIYFIDKHPTDQKNKKFYEFVKGAQYLNFSNIDEIDEALADLNTANTA